MEAGAHRFNIITEGKEVLSCINCPVRRVPFLAFNTCWSTRSPITLLQAAIVPDSVQTVNGIEAYTPKAKGELINYLASRALIERVMREKLLATHANVKVRWASPAAGLQHGSGADKGCITGAHFLPPPFCALTAAL